MYYEIDLKEPDWDELGKKGQYKFWLLQEPGDTIAFFGWGLDRVLNAAHAYARRHGFIVTVKSNKWLTPPSVEVRRGV